MSMFVRKLKRTKVRQKDVSIFLCVTRHDNLGEILYYSTTLRRRCIEPRVLEVFRVF